MPDAKPVAEPVKSPEEIAEIEAKSAGHVKMMKDDVVSFVHPTTVAAHKAADWAEKAWKYV